MSNSNAGILITVIMKHVKEASLVYSNSWCRYRTKNVEGTASATTSTTSLIQQVAYTPKMWNRFWDRKWHKSKHQGTESHHEESYLAELISRINQQEGSFQHHSGNNQPILAVRNRNVIIMFEVPTVITTKRTIFWDVMLCRIVEVWWCLEGDIPSPSWPTAACF